jgi:hypothetical protein
MKGGTSFFGLPLTEMDNAHKRNATKKTKQGHSNISQIALKKALTSFFAK